MHTWIRMLPLYVIWMINSIESLSTEDGLQSLTSLNFVLNIFFSWSLSILNGHQWKISLESMLEGTNWIIYGLFKRLQYNIHYFSRSNHIQWFQGKRKVERTEVSVGFFDALWEEKCGPFFVLPYFSFLSVRTIKISSIIFSFLYSDYDFYECFFLKTHLEIQHTSVIGFQP